MKTRSMLLLIGLVLLLITPWLAPSAFAARIVAWGYNGQGQCDVPDGNDFLAVAAAGYHSLALRVDGSIVAWGSNEYGQCDVPAGNDFVAIAAADRHSLAIRSDGSVVAWGDNDYGQCYVPAGDYFVAVAGGMRHSVALRSDGSVLVWGCVRYAGGQCDVPPGKDFVAIAANGDQNLALRADGSIYAWGQRRGGSYDVPEGNDFVAIGLGGAHNLALRADGSVAAAGSNAYGQCDVPEGNDSVAIAAGGYHSLALRRDGSIVAWGENKDGQCNVPAGNDFIAIAAGTVHNLALMEEPTPAEGFIYVDAVNGNDNNNGATPQTAFATIQKAIDAAPDYRPPPRAVGTPAMPVTILVYPGVYAEAINFKGKAITLASAKDAAILEAPSDYAVSFYSGEGPAWVLKNFVIRNSYLGIFMASSSPTITNVTVVDNQFGIAAYAGADPDISNSILWNNADGDLFGCEARYSCIEEGAEGEGNISINPLFADPANGNYHLLSERGRYVPDYSLWSFDEATSPCIDAGDPNVAASNERMPNGGRINMGAYGGTAYASLSVWPLAGDLNRDGSVDFGDLVVLCQQWLTELPSAAVVAKDTTAPEPDPAQWEQDGEPREIFGGAGAFDYYANMTAVVATDASGYVEYFFECVDRSELSSGWKTANTYTVLVGRSGQDLRFRVKARDLHGNETAWSLTLAATTIQ